MRARLSAPNAPTPTKRASRGRRSNGNWSWIKKEADEIHRQRGHPARGVHRGVKGVEVFHRKGAEKNRYLRFRFFLFPKSSRIRTTTKPTITAKIRSKNKS